MSASDENSAIYVTDTAKQIAEKVGNCRFIASVALTPEYCIRAQNVHLCIVTIRSTSTRSPEAKKRRSCNGSWAQTLTRTCRTSTCDSSWMMTQSCSESKRCVACEIFCASFRCEVGKRNSEALLAHMSFAF